MNRRGFFAAIAAALIAPKPETEKLMRSFPESYFKNDPKLMIHPTGDTVCIWPRDAGILWKD